MFLWAPNLIGYVRVITFVVALLQADAASPASLWAVTLSLLLDYFDGPVARRLNMCSQFGDLLDHFTDHATMMWLVYITAAPGVVGQLSLSVSAVYNTVAFVYMAMRGHYFKHSSNGNPVTRAFESNNYWNLPALVR